MTEEAIDKPPQTILIVEDNALNMRLFNDLLEAFAYKTVCVQDGHAVLATAIAAKPDLILMDIQLPDISGFDLVKQVLAEPSLVGVPVVAITAFAMRGDEDKIKEAGFVGYISKPISVLGFLDEVKLHLAKTTEIRQDAAFETLHSTQPESI